MKSSKFHPLFVCLLTTVSTYLVLLGLFFLSLMVVFGERCGTGERDVMVMTLTIMSHLLAERFVRKICRHWRDWRAGERPPMSSESDDGSHHGPTAA